MAWNDIFQLGTTQGSDIQKRLMQEYSDIVSGKTAPQNTSMFKWMSQYMNQIANPQTAEFMRTATSKGIEGGALEKGLTDINAAQKSAQLKGIQDIYNQASQGSAAISKDAIDRSVGIMKQQQDFYLGNKTLENQRDIARMEGVTKGCNQTQQTTGDILCMIFMTADCFTCNVKRFRDSHFTLESNVTRGYWRMSKWLVPIMVKHSVIRKLVRFILSPFVMFADAYEENKNWRARLVALPCLVICILWDLYGRLEDRIAIS